MDWRNKYPQKVINNLNTDLSSKHKWDDREGWAFWSVVLGKEEDASVQWMARMASNSVWVLPVIQGQFPPTTHL